MKALEILTHYIKETIGSHCRVIEARKQDDVFMHSNAYSSVHCEPPDVIVTITVPGFEFDRIIRSFAFPENVTIADHMIHLRDSIEEERQELAREKARITRELESALGQSELRLRRIRDLELKLGTHPNCLTDH